MTMFLLVDDLTWKVMLDENVVICEYDNMMKLLLLAIMVR